MSSGMALLRSGAAALGIGLTPGQEAGFETYYRELVDWNRRVNLTTITDYEGVQVRHFLDSLTVVLVTGRLLDGSRVIDIGSGAGLPGMPLKVVFPSLRLTLLEATFKKVRFLEHLVKALSIENVEIVAGRAEELGHDPRYRENFDLVLGRAVAALPALLELGLPFTAVGGRLIAWKKGDIGREIAESKKAAAILGGGIVEIVPVNMDGLRDGRCLVVVEKVGVTPGEYPRRPGLPVRRPLR